MGGYFSAKRQTGFTIVELLIVIVVIGVLAAIVIVAYNGITQSAKQSSIQSAVSQTTKLFSVYLAKNGSYPTVGAYTCLAAYDSSDQCRYWSSTYYARDSALESALQTVGTLPTFPDDLHPTYYGLALRYNASDTYNSRPARYTLTWKLQGDNQDCGNGSVRLAANVWTNAPYHASSSGYTHCFVLVPDPQG